MRLEKIQLENFRNYSKVEAEVDSDLVLILGQNAAGKTNFLESIYYLSRLKSFRSPDEFLAKQTADFFNVQGSLGEKKLEVIVLKTPAVKRQFKIDGQKTTRGLWDSFRTVLFVPSDLNLFSSGPKDRRKFLDEILSQKNKEYALALVSLDHVLKQKSALLQQLNLGMGDTEQLEFWNLQLVEVSGTIIKHRKTLIDFLKNNFNRVNSNLTSFDSRFEIIYEPQEVSLEILRSYQQAEIRSGMNLVGPHRDDFILRKDGTLNIHNSSRGELRAQILTLKLLQAEYLSDDKQKPIILLDDVFSELDETRRSKLLETLKGHQIFITTTEEHHLPKMDKDVLILEVSNNQIKKL